MWLLVEYGTEFSIVLRLRLWQIFENLPRILPSEHNLTVATYTAKIVLWRLVDDRLHVVALLIVGNFVGYQAIELAVLPAHVLPQLVHFEANTTKPQLCIILIAHSVHGVVACVVAMLSLDDDARLAIAGQGVRRPEGTHRLHEVVVLLLNDLPENRTTLANRILELHLFEVVLGAVLENRVGRLRAVPVVVYGVSGCLSGKPRRNGRPIPVS